MKMQPYFTTLTYYRWQSLCLHVLVQCHFYGVLQHWHNNYCNSSLSNSVQFLFWVSNRIDWRSTYLELTIINVLLYLSGPNYNSLFVFILTFCIPLSSWQVVVIPALRMVISIAFAKLKIWNVLSSWWFLLRHNDWNYYSGAEMCWKSQWGQ